MSTTPEPLDEILKKLAKDVESAVHSLYRRQHGANTAKVRTEHFVRDAREHISASIAGAPPPPPRPSDVAHQRFSASSVAETIPSEGGAAGWTTAEATAVTKCVMGWLSMGAPSSAKPDSRCIPAGSQLLPTWGDREMARVAIRKVRVAG